MNQAHPPLLDPDAGIKMEVKTVKTKGDIRNRVEPEYETRHIYVVLHAVYMDYIMRCHVTHWFPPNSTYPGGWCRCSSERKHFCWKI